MKKYLLTIAITISFNCIAQVGVGTLTPNGALDITSTDNGLLIPRIALSATTTATVLTPTTSELVYNTATAGDVTPGFYYWNGTIWVRIGAEAVSDDWSLNGNSATVPGTNYIGTSDATDLRFKTNDTDRLNISNTNGQVQSYFPGTNASPAFSWNADDDTGVFRSAANQLGLTTNGVEGLRLRDNSNVSIGATYASTNAAPANGLRVQGKTVIGKETGEDIRDIFSSHTSPTAYNNVTGYPGVTALRAISGYANSGGMGVFGFADRTGYGVVGLTQPLAISSFVQTGEGVLGQADGSLGVTTIPIGVHGIIDEATAGLSKATPVLGENNNSTIGIGLNGGAYSPTSNAVSAVYGNMATRQLVSTTNSFQFGVIGDVLLLGGTAQPDVTGGVLGTNAASDFGILGYRSSGGTFYSGYFATAGGVVTGAGRTTQQPNDGNHIGIGVNGGFMGGYVKGSQYGLVAKGDKFGMYIQGKTLTNEPVVQLVDNGTAKRDVLYSSSSTNVDVTTRGNNQLSNGTVFIPFKNAFKQSISSNAHINVTVTPTSETNGVYVTNVTTNGFYVKENMSGTSNASFNWTAIGTRKGYENGVEISNAILDSSFDNNFNEAMHNDGDTKDGKAMHYDGNDIKFERMPDHALRPQNKKVSNKN